MKRKKTMTEREHPAIIKEESILAGREERVAEARNLTLFSDVFMMTALNDIPACQYVLRILTGMKDLCVKEIRTQYRIAKTTSHDVILDVLAEDSQKKLFAMEIQRADTLDHARRVRYYVSMVDSEYLKKGKDYREMPEVYMIYISKTDLWKTGKSFCTVEKILQGTGIGYDDGVHLLYVNAGVEDGTEIAELMRYFKTADPEDSSHGALSKRIHFLKCEEGGYEIMCEMSEKWLQEGYALGEKNGEKRAKMKTALRLMEQGMPTEKIAVVLDENAEQIKKWLQEQVAAVRQ